MINISFLMLLWLPEKTDGKKERENRLQFFFHERDNNILNFSTLSRQNQIGNWKITHK